mgnify:FL=1
MNRPAPSKTPGLRNVECVTRNVAPSRPLTHYALRLTQNSRISTEQNRSRRGLTLVELFVTLVLFALIAATLAATFAGGVKVWERFQTVGAREQWLQVAFDQFRRDLHDARRFQPIPFQGAYDAVSFPALVLTAAEARDDQELGRVGYFWDGTRRRLCRSHESYRRLAHAGLKDTCEAVISDLDRLRLSYYTWDPADEAYEWSSSWSASEPPLAVKLELTYSEPSSRRAVTQALIVHVPIATSGRPQPP